MGITELALVAFVLASQVSGIGLLISGCTTITDCFAFNEACYGASAFPSCTAGGTEATCISGDSAFPCALVDQMYDDNVMMGCTTVSNDLGNCGAPYCFPGTATVQLEDGSSKVMSEVEVGDRVLVGPGKFSEVYMFTHRDHEVITTFTKLTTSLGELELSPGHYLYLNGSNLATAQSVKVGDFLLSHSGQQVPVTATSLISNVGLYNPHTLDGDIVVNGIKTSTYTHAVSPSLAHTLLSPVRAIYRIGSLFPDTVHMAFDALSSLFVKGCHAITSSLPDGHALYSNSEL